MSFGCNLYSFAKRQNSTAIPTLDTTESEHFEIDVKEPFSIMNPQLVFEFEPGYNPTIYNYAYIAQWERRYRITDWTNERGLWVATCDVDVLGTYRRQIGATPLYVLRAANASDGALTDTLYPAKTSDILRTATGQKIFTTDIEQGCFVVGVISDDADGYGAVTYYALERQQFAWSMSYLLSKVDWLNINSIEDNLQKAIFNPLQYIASCQFFPFKITNGTSVNRINIGWWEDSLQAQIMGPEGPQPEPQDTELGKRINANNPVQSFTLNFPLDNHPQISRGSYLNFAPYCNMTLYLQPFGVIPIDVSGARADGATMINVVIDVDCMSGIATATIGHISGGNIYAVDQITAKVSFDIPLAQISTDMAGAAGAAVGSLGSALTGNWLGASVGIASAVASAMIPKVGQVGSYTGALSEYFRPPVLVTQYFEIADEDNEHNGRPLCQVRTPASLGGFMRVERGDISAPATGPELERIKGYLESGFYYE